MKVACITMGSRGDIQPFIGLARSLNAHGHPATVITHPWANSLLKSYQINHIALKEAGSQYVSPGRGFRHFIKLMRYGVDSMLHVHEQLLGVCGDFDLIVGHYGMMGLAEAEILDKPYIAFAISSDLIGRKKSNGFLGSLQSHVLKATVLKPYRQYRRSLGLPAESNATKLTLLAQSSCLVETDENWVQPVEIVGYQFLPPPENYSPPEHLLNFIRNGAPPVLITFGSNLQEQDKFKSFYQNLITAIQAVGMRAIIQIPNAQPPSTYRENICLIQSVPYAWLLQNVSLAIHHCGYGTMAEILKAGLPSVVIPQAMDQFTRAREMYQQGVVPQWLDWEKATARQIGQAIRAAISDRFTARIKQVAAAIDEECRVPKAVQAIEKHFSAIIPDNKQQLVNVI